MTNVGFLDPGSVNGDAPDSATSVAEMPVGSSFAVAIAFPGVHFHVIAVAAQANFQCSGICHVVAPSFEIVAVRGCSSCIIQQNA